MANRVREVKRRGGKVRGSWRDKNSQRRCGVRGEGDTTGEGQMAPQGQETVSGEAEYKHYYREDQGIVRSGGDWVERGM